MELTCFSLHYNDSNLSVMNATTWMRNQHKNRTDQPEQAHVKWSNIHMVHLPASDYQITTVKRMQSDQHWSSVHHIATMAQALRPVPLPRFNIMSDVKYEDYQHFFAKMGDVYVRCAIPLSCSGTRDTPATYVVPHGCTVVDMTAAAMMTSQWLSSVARAASHSPLGRPGSVISHHSYE